MTLQSLGHRFSPWGASAARNPTDELVIGMTVPSASPFILTRGGCHHREPLSISNQPRRVRVLQRPRLSRGVLPLPLRRVEGGRNQRAGRDQRAARRSGAAPRDQLPRHRVEAHLRRRGRSAGEIEDERKGDTPLFLAGSPDYRRLRKRGVSPFLSSSISRAERRASFGASMRLLRRPRLSFCCAG